jgi:hypothetical protein
MKTSARLTPYLMGLIVALLVWGAPVARAQQTMEIPPPSSQTQPPIHYRPKPTPRPKPRTTPPPVEQYQPEEPTPAPTPPPPIESTPAPTPAPESFQMQQPVLPAIFRGCWQGNVQFLDSIERLPGAAKIGTWTPKTYRLCYERYGNGPFQLTFTEAGIQRNSKITNAQGAMNLLSTDGHTYATMLAQLHFDEYRNGDYFSGATFAVDETTRLQCDIEPDGMHVIGSVRGTREGDPWFRAYWHALFVHVPS